MPAFQTNHNSLVLFRCTLHFQKKLHPFLRAHKACLAISFMSWVAYWYCSTLNYRPISLTCIVCKILEHIISTNMYQHLEDNHIICRQQHGFRKRYSCETQLITTIATTLNNGGQAHAILLRLLTLFPMESYVINCPRNVSVVSCWIRLVFF